MMTHKHADRIKELEGKRPKKYETFTSRKGEYRLPFQKTRYSSEDQKRGGRVMVDEQVQFTLQSGMEFDVYTACLGGKDGKIPPSPALYKMVTEGYTKDGKKGVLLDPSEVQAFLEDRCGNGRIIFWKDRPRPESELVLEKALAEKVQVINARDIQLAEMRKLLKGRGMKDDEIDAAMARGQESK